MAEAVRDKRVTYFGQRETCQTRAVGVPDQSRAQQPEMLFKNQQDKGPTMVDTKLCKLSLRRTQTGIEPIRLDLQLFGTPNDESICFLD